MRRASTIRRCTTKYIARRKCLIDGLNRLPGVYSPIPMGAFYTVARLPIDDSDRFCAWCLGEFDYEGETVMLAPASGFYSDPTCGRNEVRIAYVLCQQDLQRAIRVLGEALKRYRREVMGRSSPASANGGRNPAGFRFSFAERADVRADASDDDSSGFMRRDRAARSFPN